MVSSSDFLRAPERPTAIATLNRQRHLTPSCGGLTPTAERTVGPARISLESLTPRPGIREQNRRKAAVPCLRPIRTWQELIGSKSKRASARSGRLRGVVDQHRLRMSFRSRHARSPLPQILDFPRLIFPARAASLFGNDCQPIANARGYFGHFFQTRLEIVGKSSGF